MHNHFATILPLLALAIGCTGRSDVGKNQTSLSSAKPSSEEAIRDFCGACHVFPPASSFPKDKWHHEVKQGFDIYLESGRSDLTATDFESTVAWFRERAPESITFEKQPSADSRAGTFERREISWTGESPLVAISHIRPIDTPQGLRLLMTDMYTGNIWQVDLKDDQWMAVKIGDVLNPSHIEPVDLNDDEIEDFVVTDLGGFNPQEETKGNLWWFQGQTSNSWKRVPLKMGMDRVADVRPLDHNRDGLTDLVVAEFGWRRTGSAYLLTNQGLQNGSPKFSWQILDDRSGSIHLPVCDFDDDESPDLIGLFGQEHESIVAYHNRGDGKFDRHMIYAAPDPAYGSSGIELIDLDDDGDQDVLYTNGDTFDDFVAKPIHAVHWLENEGTYPYKHHRLTSMPGVYRAVSGDIDSDGDIDIVAVSLLTDEDMAREPPGTFDSVIWLEQTSPGNFERRRIEADNCRYATCVLIDINGDDRLDIVTAPFDYGRRESDKIVVFEFRPL